MLKGLRLLVVLGVVFSLSGCFVWRVDEENDGPKPTNSQLTTTVQEETIDFIEITTFTKGGYYILSNINPDKKGTVRFFDEVDRFIQGVDTDIPFVKIPEYTAKIVTWNVTLEEHVFEENFVYPKDVEIKDTERGGEKPVYVLKSELQSGDYDILYRNYLQREWTIRLYKDNKVVEVLNYGNTYQMPILENYKDFDYAQLYNCSLKYKEYN